MRPLMVTYELKWYSSNGVTSEGHFENVKIRTVDLFVNPCCSKFNLSMTMTS